SGRAFPVGTCAHPHVRPHLPHGHEFRTEDKLGRMRPSTTAAQHGGQEWISACGKLGYSSPAGPPTSVAASCTGSPRKALAWPSATSTANRPAGCRSEEHT